MQLIFFLAMTKYQDVQHRAQDEIDAVVGNRLPTFEDLRNLPYVRAIMKETLRWRVVAPSSTCFLVSQTIWPRN
jgi:cytochrome P450